MCPTFLPEEFEFFTGDNTVLPGYVAMAYWLLLSSDFHESKIFPAFWTTKTG